VLLSNTQGRFNQLNRFHIILILTLLGLTAYANALRHPFVHDDAVFIQYNPYIHDLDLRNIFIQTTVPDERFPLVNRYYRPCLEALNRLLYRAFGLNPYAFHFFNILLHILNSFLVYNLVLRLTGLHKGTALAAAVLFLSHPVQSEAVACVAGVSNLVFTFLCLLSFYGYLLSTTNISPGRRALFYAFSLVLFFTALLSKEQSVVLPFLIILYEAVFAASPLKIPREKYRLVGGFFIVMGVYFLLRKILFGHPLTPVLESPGELILRLLAVPRTLLIFLGLVLFPRDLHYYRNQDILLPWLWPLAGLAAAGAAVFYLVRRAPDIYKTRMMFGLGFFIISLLPTLNIVPLVNEYSKILTAEHFLYFPLIGLLLVFLSLGRWWLDLKPAGARRALSVGGLAALVIVYTGITVKQNTYWRGEVPLFERTLQFEQDFGRGHILLAKAYAAQGQMVKAIEHDRRALEIMEGYLRRVKQEKVAMFYINFIKDINHHLGYCYEVLGDLDQSHAYYARALNLDPGSGRLHYALGISYLKMQDLRHATSHFEQAVKLDPHDLSAKNSLALCYQELGEYGQAETLLRAVAEEDSRSVSARRNLEIFLEKKKTLPQGAGRLLE
jgi:tetratricopeptide (TPR) repeat protein